MFNQATRCYEMTDESGSYNWITEGWDRADYQDWKDSDIYNYVDQLIDQAIETETYKVPELAESKRYPCFGYTTADVFQNEDEYSAFLTDEIETDLKNEREYVFGYLKSWIGKRSHITFVNSWADNIDFDNCVLGSIVISEKNPSTHEKNYFPLINPKRVHGSSYKPYRSGSDEWRKEANRALASLAQSNFVKGKR